jgi:mutual gliding-motility protein MglA
MFINWRLREITLKIVYYGPALSGKTTNLEYIHAKTNPAMRGELVSLRTHDNHTICFNFLQVGLGQIRGLTHAQPVHGAGADVRPLRSQVGVAGR